MFKNVQNKMMEKWIKRSQQKDWLSASILFYCRIRSKTTVRIIEQKSIVLKDGNLELL